MSNNTATVTILDRDYQISCEEQQQQELSDSAAKLDATMRDIRRTGKVIGLERIALMAGLNLSHELIRGVQQTSSSHIQQEKQLLSLNNRLDKAIAKYQRLNLRNNTPQQQP
ncbi:cell division protein ZapA [Sinobacterium caligoides]|uniref:Cell division protein ZapA n=1 Tax=Sinobacterium caligoides TaxID=933926 RepID=A0A3N2DGD7_9GAMM|nr:cell division protein ZapA [Sinobacterium caligoides]ROR98860.1 cell division protein ZapA [Sinobacterium caligoides]